jgi:hypothetical protein
MAATLTVGQAVKRGSWVISIAKDYWDVSRDFKAFVLELDNATITSIHELVFVLPLLNLLNSNINKLIDLTYKSGLSDRMLIGVQFRSIKRHNERLQDIIEHFQLSLDPSTPTDAKQAREEYDRNETVSLDSLV